MGAKLKRKKKYRYRLSCEVVTEQKTYAHSIEVSSADEVFGEDEQREELFDGAGIPEDLGPDDLLSMTFKVERL